MDNPPENFKTHAPSSAGHSASGGTVTFSSPYSSFSHAMDSLFIRPKLKHNTRRRRAAYNHTVVMVTDDGFLKTLEEDKQACGRKPPHGTSTSRRRQNQEWGGEE